MYYAEFYETTVRHCRTTTSCLYLEEELHSDEIFIKLVSHWVMHFGDRNCKYRHDNLQAIFHII